MKDGDQHRRIMNLQFANLMGTKLKPNKESSIILVTDRDDYAKYVKKELHDSNWKLVSEERKFWRINTKYENIALEANRTIHNFEYKLKSYLSN